MVTLDKIYHAAYVLKQVARRTELIYVDQVVTVSEDEIAAAILTLI